MNYDVCGAKHPSMSGTRCQLEEGHRGRHADKGADGMLQTWPIESDDPVHPQHYSGDACMVAIEKALGDVESIGFFRGQVIKYMWRLHDKDDPATNAKKAKWYLDRLISRLEGGE